MTSVIKGDVLSLTTPAPPPYPPVAFTGRGCVSVAPSTKSQSETRKKKENINQIKRRKKTKWPYRSLKVGQNWCFQGITPHHSFQKCAPSHKDFCERLDTPIPILSLRFISPVIILFFPFSVILQWSLYSSVFSEFCCTTLLSAFLLSIHWFLHSFTLLTSFFVLAIRTLSFFLNSRL